MNNILTKTGKIAGLVFAGFLLGRGCNQENEVKALTWYDMNGDGVEDAVISLGKDMSLPNHGFYAGYIDGKNIQKVTKSNTDYLGNTNVETKKIANGGLTALNYAMFTPNIKERLPDYVDCRGFEIQPSEDGKTLDLVVRDYTKDFITFNRTNFTGMPNPEYKGK